MGWQLAGERSAAGPAFYICGISTPTFTTVASEKKKGVLESIRAGQKFQALKRRCVWSVLRARPWTLSLQQTYADLVPPAVFSFTGSDRWKPLVSAKCAKLQNTPEEQIKDSAQKGVFQLECENTACFGEAPRSREKQSSMLVMITNRGKASSAPQLMGTTPRPELQPWCTSIAWKQDPEKARSFEGIKPHEILVVSLSSLSSGSATILPLTLRL